MNITIMGLVSYTTSHGYNDLGLLYSYTKSYGYNDLGPLEIYIAIWMFGFHGNPTNLAIRTKFICDIGDNSRMFFCKT